MMHRHHAIAGVWLGLTLLVSAGCPQRQGDGGGPTPGAGASRAAPTFSLAWSEYPSWSVFGVADELGLVNGEKGKQGPIEEKYGVDIELREAGYDSCLNMYGAGDCDAVCITNMDALIVSPSRDSVAVLPTSTSLGADACLVTGNVKDLEDLKQHKVYGLKGTVSEYCFVRCLEKLGGNEADYEFTNQDPAVAATNMQQGAESHQAIMVWNPFVLQTLNDRSDVRVLFDSREIPGEIVDMVVIGRDALAREGGDQFVRAVIETFYEVNRQLDSPERGDELLVALGKKFSNLGLEDMKKVVEQTVFYKTPDDGRKLLEGPQFVETMKAVEEFCVGHGLVNEASVGYGPDAGQVKLRFDASFLQ